MRDIKFEIVARNIHFDEVHRHVFTLEQIWESREIDTWLRSDNCELIARRQYTGLKDKNDVEIYEGDIVAEPHTYWMKKDGTPDKRWKRGTHFPSEVVAWGEFNENWFGYEADGEAYLGWNLLPEKASSVEVIGNIYESPELLETGKDK